MRTAIYINGRKLDLSSNTNLSLTFRSAAFTSIDKLKNGYSNTVRIPRTANNETAFGAVVFPSSSSNSPYIYHAASIELDGVLVVPSAVAYITEVTTDSINLCLLWDSVVKLSAMIAEKRKLNELPYNKTTDVITWTKAYAKSFSTFDMGLQGEDMYTAMHPSVTVKSVLQRICTTYELPVPPNADISDFADWEIPLTTRVDPIITDGDGLKENNVTCWYGSSCMYLSEPTSQTLSTNGWRTHYPIFLGRVGVASGYPPDSELPDIELPIVRPMRPSFEQLGNPSINDSTIVPPTSVTPVPDTDNPLPSSPSDVPEWVSRELRGIKADDTYLQYLVPFKPNLRFVCTGKVRIPLMANNTATPSFMMANVKLQLVLYYRPLNSTSDYNEEILLSVDAYNATSSYITFHFDSAKSAAIPYPILGFIIDTYNTADVRVQWRIYYEGNSSNEVKLDYGKSFGSDSITGTALYLQASQDILRINSDYYLVPNYPKIGCVDFMKALGQMTGRFLTVEAVFDGTKRKTVTRYRSYEEFEQRKAEAADWSDYMVRALGSITGMSFKVGEWAQRNIFKYKDGETFDAVDSVDVFIENKSLADEQTSVELPFSAAVSRDATQTLYIPLYKYQEGKSMAEYESKGDAAYIGEVKAGRIVNTLKWNRLIKSYEAMMKPLRAAKVIKERMCLPFVVLQNMDIYRPVYLRQYGSYFAILEIKTRQDGTCDVELLKI